MCAVKLTTPSQQLNSASQQQLPEWITQIDEMELLESSHKMYETLKRYNHSKLDVQQRHQLMDALQSPMLRLLEKLERSYLGCSSNSGKAECQNVGKQIRQLLHETCSTYNIIIHQLAAQESSADQQLLLAHNINSALRYQARHLMDHFFTYQPISADIWGEIKLLFRYARQRKLENNELLDQEGIPQTITEAFISALLFASINPFRLKQQEIIDSYQVVSRWARHCRLLSCDESWIPQGEWVVDLSSERPPEFFDAKQAILDRDSLLRIDLEKISQEAKQHLSLEGYGQLIPQLLDRLQHGWKSSPPRSYERRSSFQETEIAVGLNNCHQLLLEDETSRSSQSTASDPLWSLHLSNRMFDEEIQPHQRILHEIYEVDVSIGGYGLRSPKQNSDKINKMDLVLIRHPNIKNETWRIGQIRWKQASHGSSDTMLGVCLLAEDASALIITNAEPGKDSALLMPGSDFDSPLATLLLPPHYQEGDILQCRAPNQSVRLKLQEAVCSGADFKQFRFALTETGPH